MWKIPAWHIQLHTQVGCGIKVFVFIARTCSTLDAAGGGPLQAGMVHTGRFWVKGLGLGWWLGTKPKPYVMCTNGFCMLSIAW
jgi:hypothetical protein